MRLIYFTENGVNLIILAVFQIKIFRKIIFLQKRLTIRLCTARNKYPLLYFKICIQNQSFDLLMTWSAVDPNYMIITRTFIKVQKWTEIKTNLNIMYITESTTYKWHVFSNEQLYSNLILIPFYVMANFSFLTIINLATSYHCIARNN